MSARLDFNADGVPPRTPLEPLANLKARLDLHGVVAHAYAARGWPVFPLRPRDKVPLIPKAAGGNGVHDATTETARVERWWTEHPDANIGLAAGPTFWVLDVDFNGFLAEEPDGADTITALQRRFGRLPATAHQYTGGLGWQHFFRPDPRIKNGVKVLPGLDTRAAGGYVVAPPSIHPDTGRAYRWIADPGEVGIATAPEWLVALLEPVELPQPATPPRHPVRTTNIGRYAAVALEKACERISGASPGQQCEVLDHEAYAIARLVAGGVIPKGEAEPALVAAGCRMRSQAGRPPWTHRQVKWRVDRALKAGERNPRTPEARP